MNLKDLGFDEWFEAHAAEGGPEGGRFARVCAVDRGAYFIRHETGEIPAELTGKLAYHIDGPAELPCVGDWVVAVCHNGGAEAVIHRVLPRRTFLRRRTPGRNADCQMIAANIDVAFIVQSCRYDFNAGRLDRYLVMAADGRVEPVVVLTKTDLVDEEELARKIETVRAATAARVIALSCMSGAGLEEFRQALVPGRTCCLLGSSGVGKTTLLNRLTGRESFATRPVSATGEGTHTTTRRQLVVLDRGAMVVDTPGMRELGIVGADDALDAGFDEIAALAAGCRYADCSHEHEPGCAVRAALERGELAGERYASYLKLRKESRYHEMSCLEKRRKDKAFGRFVKSVKKRARR
ncbi:ribosome biogenesis GTPase RsgA [Desulfovibrio sp. X2]|uniref:ribosome small subunit-dependent GTPase A n=1 Tax=Desulfovibrio sp. X2 TaxID=941449 RepID=UPI00035883D7|nr:ribosome small subunit-dependent GTPase A [Desulfovibrio sp. X2]EPR42123.1 ribosome biogenesis GTPase RsgA [Desulfovibrio sp. X2]